MSPLSNAGVHAAPEAMIDGSSFEHSLGRSRAFAGSDLPSSLAFLGWQRAGKGLGTTVVDQ